MQRTHKSNRPQVDRLNKGAGGPAFLFDLDGTLVDSVYQHVLAWREALEQAGIELAVWRIHRRIGMSGGLRANNLLRETGRRITAKEAAQLQRIHAEAYARQVSQVRSLPGARGTVGLSVEERRSVGHCHQWSPGECRPGIEDPRRRRRCARGHARPGTARQA